MLGLSKKSFPVQTITPTAIALYPGLFPGKSRSHVLGITHSACGDYSASLLHSHDRPRSRDENIHQFPRALLTPLPQKSEENCQK